MIERALALIDSVKDDRVLFIGDAIVEAISELQPFVSTLAIYDLGIIKISVVPMAEDVVVFRDGVEFVTAVGLHLGHFFVVVIPCVIECR